MKKKWFKRFVKDKDKPQKFFRVTKLFFFPVLRDSYFFTGFCYKPGTDYNESGEEYCEKCFE